LSQIGSVHEDVEEDEEDEEEEEEDDYLEDFNNVPDAFAEFADDRISARKRPSRRVTCIACDQYNTFNCTIAPQSHFLAFQLHFALC
jgi:hypothetical protein